MGHDAPAPGQFMAVELEQSVDVFVRAASLDLSQAAQRAGLGTSSAFYTIARGSSDAAANILSYEFMRELQRPTTSLPPSVFSVGGGVSLGKAAGIVISQSGASDDLVQAAQGMREAGSPVVAITNTPGSRVEAQSTLTIPIDAGEEKAVPATKTVVGSVAAGLSLLAALKPDYAAHLRRSVASFSEVENLPSKAHADLRDALIGARHVYVVGRDTGFGAAHEIALKIKETCAIHAEAYSASEVLHGPLQLATKPMMVVVLDTGLASVADSLEQAVSRFQRAGVDLHRIRPQVLGLTPAAAAAALLRHIYPVILETALSLGMNPDAPEALSKVTVTR